MNSERLQELLSAAEDDALTAVERQELENMLADSPEARETARATQRLTEFLASAELLDVPEDFSQKVLAALPRQKESRRSVGGDWWRSLFTPVVLGYASAATLGVLAIALVYEMRPELVTLPDHGHLAGTLSAQGAGDVVVLSTGSYSVEARLDQGDDELTLDIRIEAAEPIQLTASLSGPRLRFTGLTDANPGDPGVRLEESKLQVVGEGNRQIAALLQTRADSGTAPEQVYLEVSREGEPVQTGVLRLKSD